MGQWIVREGPRYGRLPSFKSMCNHHDEFHRAAAEVVKLINGGQRDEAFSLMEAHGSSHADFERARKTLMDCSRGLYREVVKGLRNTGVVRDVLQGKESQHIYLIQSSATVMEALRMMVNRNIGALAVYTGENFSGLFTERCYTRNLVSREGITLESTPSGLIDPDTVYVQPDDSVEQCMVLMTSSHKRHLPVMEGGLLKGVISIGDVVKHVTREDRELHSQLENDIHGQYGNSLLLAVEGAKNSEGKDTGGRPSGDASPRG